MLRIVDASVAIKWFSKEQGWEKANAVLEDIKKKKIQIVVPDLFFYEIGNVILYKKEKREIANKIFNLLQNLHFEIVSVALLSFSKMYDNAVNYSITFYDASYIVLMKERNCEFITADKKLYQKMYEKFPSIQLL